MAYIHKVSKSSPISYYPWDEASSPITDRGPQGGTATLVAGHTFSSRNAKCFPMTAGSDGCARLSYISGTDYGRWAFTNYNRRIHAEETPFSIEFWFAPVAGDFSGYWDLLYDYSIAKVYATGFGIYNGMLVWGVGGDQISLGNLLGQDKFLEGGRVAHAFDDRKRAHHVVGVFSGSGIILYINGKPVAAANVKPFTRDLDNPSIAVQSGGNTGGTIFVEHLANYARALTPDEIRAHYEAGTDYVDYERAFNAEGADFFDITDADAVAGFEKDFSGEDWLNATEVRGLTLTTEGVRLNRLPDAIPYLMGETPYENIVDDQKSETVFYDASNWTASGGIISGDGAGLPYSAQSMSRPYSIYASKNVAGPGSLKLYTTQNVTAGQSYRIQMHHSANKDYRFYVTWKTAANATISTDYGTDRTANTSVSSAHLTEMHLRAPVNAAYGEFGVENRNNDAVLNDYIWIDRFKLYRDLYYSASSYDGVYVYNNQGILYPNIGSQMGQNYAGIFVAANLNTSTHGDSSNHVIWQLRSQDGYKLLTLKVGTTNALQMVYDYYNPVTALWEQIVSTGNTVASYGTAGRNIYVEIQNETATCYVNSTGDFFTLTNTSPAPLTFDSSTDIVIGNSFDYDEPWNERLKTLTVHSVPESTKNFSSTQVGPFTLRMSRSGSVVPGSLSVAQYGYAIYQFPLPDMIIHSSRLIHSPDVRDADAPTEMNNVSVKVSTNGTSWSSAIPTGEKVTNFDSGVVTSNSTIWFKVELFCEDSDGEFIPYMNKLKAELFESAEIRGKTNSRVMTIAGTNPIFGYEDLHPSSLYYRNGFSTNSTSGFYLGAESSAGETSIDGSGTVPAVANGYRTVEFMFKLNATPASGDYLFYHNGGSVRSISFNGTNWVSSGFTTVYFYDSSGQRTTLGAGKTPVLHQWTYVVAVSPTVITPTDSSTSTRFNFGMQLSSNATTTSPDVTIKFVGLYANTFTQADVDRHFNILRSRNNQALTDSVGATVSEPVSAATVTGTWGYKQISVDEPTDSAL